MDPSLKESKDPVRRPETAPQPYQVPSLVDLILKELLKHRSRIVSLDACSVSDAAPVLAHLSIDQLTTIEANTERDLKEDPSWDALWEAHCQRLSIPQMKDKTWRETWSVLESRRKKYASTKPAEDKGLGSSLMTSQEIEVKRAKEAWKRKVANSLPLNLTPQTKRSKYR